MNKKVNVLYEASLHTKFPCLQRFCFISFLDLYDKAGWPAYQNDASIVTKIVIIYYNKGIF